MNGAISKAESERHSFRRSNMSGGGFVQGVVHSAKPCIEPTADRTAYLGAMEGYWPTQPEEGAGLPGLQNGGQTMKAFVYRTSDIHTSQGEFMESESLDILCSSLLESPDHGKLYGGLVISKPDHDHPWNREIDQCDWIIEIYDDYRE